MDHALGIIQIAGIDRHARVAGALKQLHQLTKRRLDIDANHISARDHHVLDTDFAEFKNIGKHLALTGRKSGRHVALAVGEHISQIFAKFRGGFSAKPLGQPGDNGFSLTIRARTSVRFAIFIG